MLRAAALLIVGVELLDVAHEEDAAEDKSGWSLLAAWASRLHDREPNQ